MKEPYRKGRSESVLASSLAGDIARYHLKRRQRYWWAGLLSFEKPMEQDADSIPSGGRQHDNHVNREWIVRSCVVLEPAHAEKQHAREPGDLLHVLVNRPRPVREGHKPHGGHERTGEVGLCRSTGEPAEQRRAAAFGGGRGGKGTDWGEHRSITHASDTEREAHVPGIARCAASSTFRRHSSTVRAVCVNAPVRICAGGDQRWSSLPRHVWSAASPQAKCEDVTRWSAQMYTAFVGVNHSWPGWNALRSFPH